MAQKCVKLYESVVQLQLLVPIFLLVPSRLAIIHTLTQLLITRWQETYVITESLNLPVWKPRGLLFERKPIRAFWSWRDLFQVPSGELGNISYHPCIAVFPELVHVKIGNSQKFTIVAWKRPMPDLRSQMTPVAECRGQPCLVVTSWP